MDDNATDSDSDTDNESFDQESGDDHLAESESGSADQSSSHSDSESDIAAKNSEDSDDQSSVGSESKSLIPQSDESDTESDVIDKFKSRGQSIDTELNGSEEEAARSSYVGESLAGLGSFLKESIRKHLVPRERTGFVQLITCLRECLLTHRWQEASQAVDTMCLYPTHQFEDYVWKCGLEVLYNHPNSDPEIIEHFTRKMEGIHIQRRRKRLENAFYLLSRGQIKDAEVTIRSAKILSRAALRKGEHILEDEKYWKMMTTAYSGMLKYMEWQEDHLASQSRDPGADQLQADRTEFTTQEACGSLGCVLDKPGVWDIFVTKQVELLEADGRVEDARELLEKYCATNEDNPNAYRYMYRLLKRNNGDQQQMIGALKEYVRRIPSDILALDLVSLLRQTAKRKNPNYSSDICLITSTLFDMLDYHCWYKRLAPWKALVKHITQILKKQNHVAINAAKVCWSKREWWPSYHFNSKAVKQLLKKNKKLAMQKAVVAMVMHTTDSSFITCIRKHFTKKQDKESLKQLDAAYKLARDSIKLGLRRKAFQIQPTFNKS